MIAVAVYKFVLKDDGLLKFSLKLEKVPIEKLRNIKPYKVWSRLRYTNNNYEIPNSSCTDWIETYYLDNEIC